MNNLQIFENTDFGRIRSLVIGNEPWFVGKDIAEILGYSDTFGALKKHVDDDDKQNCQNSSFESNRGLTIINESGLYSLILSSKLPNAKRFKHWVTSEVLPSIRKTGSYSKPTKQPIAIQQQRAEAMLLNAKSRQSKLWLTIADKTDIKEYKHICQQKAAEALVGVPVLPMEEVTEKTYSATEIARMLGTNANKIGKLANAHHLKTAEYGKLFYDKSPNSCKEVETFRYYSTAIEVFRRLLNGQQQSLLLDESTKEGGEA